MKKKILLVFSCLLALIILTGCMPRKEILDGKTVSVIYESFIVLEDMGDINGNGETYLVYHRDTGIMYYIIERYQHAGITECYIFDDETNECHVAHYPEDY